MDLTSIKNIKNLLKARGSAPSRRLGQNFLIDRDAVKKIIDAADIQPDDIVLEIGPGLGVLTQELAKRAKKVIAVEKDPRMVEILHETMKSYGNVEVVNEDIRFLISGTASTPGVDGETPGVKSVSEIKKSNFKVVGNLPFYLTAPVIRQFLELAEVRPPQMTLVVQKEVAQRICAKPPKMNLLAVSVQIYAGPEIVSYIPKESFWPSPEVDAAILKIQNPKPKIQNVDRGLFFKIVKAGFSQPRKQLANNLASDLKADKVKIGEWLLQNNIRPAQRAETLSIVDWLRLTKNYKID